MRHAKGTIKKVFGVVLISLGVMGWLLPILPGWIFIFIGLELVGINLVFFDKIKEYVKSKIKKQRECDDENRN